jgi:hypothetical protein
MGRGRLGRLYGRRSRTRDSEADRERRVVNFKTASTKPTCRINGSTGPTSRPSGGRNDSVGLITEQSETWAETGAGLENVTRKRSEAEVEEVVGNITRRVETGVGRGSARVSEGEREPTTAGPGIGLQ